eukprot:scaffold215768_cov31-Tisochrysis_lutea.AAC.3
MYLSPVGRTGGTAGHALGSRFGTSARNPAMAALAGSRVRLSTREGRAPRRAGSKIASIDCDSVREMRDHHAEDGRQKAADGSYSDRAQLE